MTKPKTTPAARRFFADPKRRQELFDLLAIGASRNDAAGKLGVTRRTIWNECDRDPEFKLAVEQSEAAGKIELIKAIHKAAIEGDWKAAYAMLQSKYFEWSRNAHDAIRLKDLVKLLQGLGEDIREAVPAEHHGALQAPIDAMLVKVLPGGDDDDGD
jgi:hypothetical protein